MSPIALSGDQMMVMNVKTDTDLLRAYVEQGAENAFAELVHRHLGLVYASALRQVQRPDLAADVAQAVFLLLARKAPGLRREVVLSGWLFRTTRFVAARAGRSEQRRQHRELEAAAMNLQNQSPSSSDELWREISPHLDDAVAALPESDRQAVLLRFFERQPLREIGARLGWSEEAAKKRVSRALEKLRSFLTRRGVTLSSMTLGTLLLDERLQGAPAGLAPTICATVSAGTASLTIAGLVAAVLRDLLWLKARSLVPWATGIAVLLVGAALLISPRPDARSNAALELRTSGKSDVAAVPAELVAPDSTAAAPNSTERHLFLNFIDPADNRPIPGVRVLADVWGFANVIESTEKMTGADGTVAMRVPAESFSTFRIWVSAAGYVPIGMDWRQHEFSASDVYYTCRLTRGAILAGEVRDEAGQPVAGARISFNGPGIDMTRRENICYLPRFSAVTTDATGRFESDQLPPEWETGGGISVGITHPDFALETFWLMNPQSVTTNRVVTLAKGIALRGAVVGSNGEPVVKASLHEEQKSFGLSTKTDSAGRFEFAHVKPGNYTITVRAAGYADLQKALVADTNAPEVTLQLHAVAAPPSSERTLEKKVRLTGLVVDAESGEPVTRFRVLLNQHRGVADQLLGDGTQGAFDWPLSPSYLREFSLIIEADGYEPQESSKRPIQEAEHKFEFRLQRGSDFTGVVLQPDGQPAAKAAVGLAAPGRDTLRLADGGRLVNYGHPVSRATTDENGRFTLRRMVGAQRVQVAHESGTAVLPAASVTNIFIRLQPYGEIQGQLLIGNAPASNQPVNVGFGAAMPGQSSLIPFDYNTTTDAEGRFHFTHVQPGTHRVQRRIMFYQGDSGGVVGFSHGKDIEVRSLETTQIVLGGQGIVVTGRLELSPALENYDWTLDLYALVQQRADLPEVRSQDFGDDSQAYMRAWSVRESQIAKYYLAIQPDGRFRTEDVLPGNYLLELKIKEPLEDRKARDAWMQHREELGRLTLPVVVADGAIDLGTLTIPLTKSPRATASSK